MIILCCSSDLLYSGASCIFLALIKSQGPKLAGATSPNATKNSFGAFCAPESRPGGHLEQ